MPVTNMDEVVTDPRVSSALKWLAERGTNRGREGMARYAIRSPKVFGVSIATMRPMIKALGRDHDLAIALWATGWLEARIAATMVDEPGKVTPQQMEAWARDFDSWAVCDGACVHLFVRTRHAWSKCRAWSARKPEFVRRAAFATLAALAVHDANADNEKFIAMLPLIERAASDDRNFVKKAVNWALRQVGKRNRGLNRAAITVARRLAHSPAASARWIGNDALRELTSAAVASRMSRR